MLNILQNHQKIDRLYNSYLIQTNDLDRSLEELNNFIANDIFKNKDIKNNPDYIILKRKDEKTKSILIGQVHQMQDFIYKTSVISNKKIAVIYAADTMNINAANSCLKILEETPKNSYFFLLTNNSASILPTIQSRCFKVDNNYTDKEEIYTIEQKYLEPLLVDISFAQKVAFFNSFSVKNIDILKEFLFSLEKLIAKLCYYVCSMGIELTRYEQMILAQFKCNSLSYLSSKYEKISKIIANINKYDLDIRANVILLVNIFEK